MNTLIKEMREWLLECFSSYDHEEIEELTEKQLYNSINKYYDGGLNQFIQDGCNL